MRYQKQGLAWMLSREATGANPAGGMLCDEQGLGKTITAIALIASSPCEVCQHWGVASLSPSPDGNSQGFHWQHPAVLQEAGGDSGETIAPEPQPEQNAELNGAVGSVQQESAPGRLLPIRSTLIVMPKSLLGQWAAAIATWVSPRVARIHSFLPFCRCSLHVPAM